jgi:hypothetical protein
MARQPNGTPINLVLAASGLDITLYVSDIQRSYSFQDFKRVEMSNGRYLNSIDSTNYSQPTVVRNALNAPIQIGSGEGCGFPYSIPLGPEDSNLANMFQRINSVTFKITGAPSGPTSVNSLQPISDEHQRRKDQFEYYLAVRDEAISYQLLQQLAGQNFNYLTNTGLSLIDPFEFGTVTNCLIKDFSCGAIHVDWKSQTCITKGWQLTLEQNTITTRSTY